MGKAFLEDILSHFSENVTKKGVNMNYIYLANIFNNSY